MKQWGKTQEHIYAILFRTIYLEINKRTLLLMSITFLLALRLLRTRAAIQLQVYDITLQMVQNILSTQ